MRIKKIKFKNYRQYKDVEIILKKKENKNDLHVFISVMGTGKSNLLNAINWCLFKEEPFLSRKDRKSPQLNLSIVKDAVDDEEYRMRVEIFAETLTNQISFLRDQYFQIHKINNDQGYNSHETREQFITTLIDDNGNSKLYTDEEANEKVKLFVPYGIKDYFFFDGERLDKYFKEATGQHIKNAIYQISQVELLDRSRIHMQKTLEGLQKDAGKKSPEIEKTRKELEGENNNIKTHSNELENCKKQIAIAKKNINKLEDNLRGMPDTEKLQKQKDSLKDDFIKQEKLYTDKIKAKNEFLFSNGINIFLWPTTKNALETFNKLEDDGQIPPTHDKDLLQKIITKEKCICERDIKCGSIEEKAILSLINSIKLSPKTSQELTKMKEELVSNKNTVELYTRKNSSITKEIKNLKEVLDGIDGKIKDIDRQLAGFDMIKIRYWREEIRKFEELRDENHKSLGIFETLLSNAKNKFKELTEILNKEILRESKLENLRNDMLLAQDIIKILEESNEEIMNSMRQQIESETEKRFLQLHWKKNTYKEVKIKDDYTISTIHNLGFDCMDTFSGGEREVLALAFSTALHNISGSDSMIVIDRPFAMVSGITTEYIANILSEISSERQVILLLTPNDYSKKVGAILEKKASNIFEMKLSKNERELKLEEYKYVNYT